MNTIDKPSSTNHTLWILAFAILSAIIIALLSINQSASNTAVTMGDGSPSSTERRP